jgi:hypothetical protein
MLRRCYVDRYVEPATRAAAGRDDDPLGRARRAVPEPLAGPIDDGSGALVTWGATVRGAIRTACDRTVVPRPGSCPKPQVRTARGRPVRVARTYSTEAPGRTCQHRSTLSPSSALPGHANAYTRSVCVAPLPRNAGGVATVRQRGLLPAPPPREVASRPKCTIASGPSLLLARAQALLEPAAARVVVMVSVCSLQLV